MSDVLACVAAVDDVSDSVDQSVVDVQHDVAALKRFSDYIVEQFDSESPQHAGLQRSLGDVAEAFRSTLANLLQRSLSDVALIEECRNRALLRSASLAGSQACDPFAFQRQHARAIQRRAAAVYTGAQFAAVEHRLFPRPPPRAIAAGSELLRQPGTGGGAIIGPSTDVDPKRATGVDVWLARRTDRPANELAAAGLPCELEALRVPLLGAMDPAGMAAVTFTALDGAAACVDASALGGSALHLHGAACPGVLLTVPAPSVLQHHPRSHAASLELVFEEQDALSQLALSQYFPDVCGTHDVLGGSTGSTADERCSILAGASALLGPTIVMLREHIPAAVSLAQLRAHCGPLHEGRPLFRHIARELLAALGDLDAQCCYDVARMRGPTAGAADGAAAITLEHVYLSESGTRLTLRGVPWAGPLSEGIGAEGGPLADWGGRAALDARSRALLRAYGCMLRALLPSDSHQGARVVRRRLAEVGFSMTVGEVAGVQLEASEAELRAAAPDGAGDAVWLEPVVQATAPPHSAAREVTRRAAARACVEVIADPAPASRTSAHPTAVAAMARFSVRAVHVGSASLLFKLYSSAAGGGGGAFGEPGDAALLGGPGAVVLVPVTVYPAQTSPVLSALMDVAAPLPAAAPIAEVVRLLEAAVRHAHGEQQQHVAGVDGRSSSSSSSVLLQTAGLLATLLSPRSAQAAADLAGQAAAAGSSNAAAVPAVLLNDFLAAIVGVLSGAQPAAASLSPAAPVLSLSQLAAHSYFSLSQLVRQHAESSPQRSTSSPASNLVDNDTEFEPRWHRAVADDYALYSFALLHSC